MAGYGYGYFQGGVPIGSKLNAFDKLAPSSLLLTVLSASSIKLDWTVNSANADGTKVERSTDGVSFTEVGSVAGATFTDTGLTDGIRYYYRVRNYKGGSNSAYTTIANTYTWLIATLTATGDGTGVSTLRMEVSETQTFTLDGAARFYTNEAGTTGESTTWEVTAGALRTIYLKCPSGTANLTIPKPDKVIKWGNSSIDGWTSSTNAAEITIEVGKLALTELRILGTSTLTGALPTNLTYLYLLGNSINWTYTGALPIGLTYLALNGVLINWTALDISGSGNITRLSLSNYRIAKMSSADMVTLLTSLTNRTGSLIETITINDYADYASPPIAVTNAVALLKSTKSVTTVNLGA